MSFSKSTSPGVLIVGLIVFFAHETCASDGDGDLARRQGVGEFSWASRRLGGPAVTQKY